MNAFTDIYIDNVRVSYVFADHVYMQLLIMKDGEWIHSMRSPMDGIPPQSKGQ